jgi:hypothetical protein
MGIIGGIVGNAIARAIGIGTTRGVDWGRHGLQLAAAIVLVFFGEMLYMSMHGRGRQRERI